MRMVFEFVPLAQVSEEIAAIMMGGIVFLIPIVAILTHHQRKMAELVHGRKQEGQQPDALPYVHDRMNAMERELAEIKELVKNQTIALDNLSRSTPPSTSEEGLADRLQG